MIGAKRDVEERMRNKTAARLAALRVRLPRLHLFNMTPRRLETMYGWLFISPVLIGLLVFSLGPIIYSLILSTQKTTGVTMGAFAGLANYRELVKDELFWQALKVSFKYALGVVPVSVALQLLVAAALNQGFKGISVFRLLYYLPAITPVVAMILVWIYIYDPANGLANQLLRALGLPKQDWLLSIRWALTSFIIMAVWGAIGPGMVLFLAGLQGISREYYEAAEMDGAGAVAKFLHITFPLISPITFLTLVLGLIGSLQTFDSVYVATKGDGSPFYTTLVMGLYIYKQAFQSMRFGYASAIAWVMAVVIFTLTYVQIRLQSRWVHYGG
jgi:multiple sugar transport system permease protein